MSAKITKRMAENAKKRGAKVEPMKIVQRPPAAGAGPVQINTPNTDALEGKIGELKAELEEMKKVAQANAQELVVQLAKASEGTPLRVKPVRDMDPSSKTYLLVEYYDFVPVEHRKLNS